MAWHTPPSPHGAMLILPPPRPQAERRPSPQPSWSLDSSQAPCLSFPASLSPLQGTRKVLQHLLDKLNPGLCTWLAKHPPASEDADLRGRPQAWGHRGPATSLRAEGSQNGGSSCPGQGHVWPGEGAGQPSGNPCPCPPFPSALEQAGGLEPFMLDRLVSEGPSRMGINAGSQASPPTEPSVLV